MSFCMKKKWGCELFCLTLWQKPVSLSSFLWYSFLELVFRNDKCVVQEHLEEEAEVFLRPLHNPSWLQLELLRGHVHHQLLWVLDHFWWVQGLSTGCEYQLHFQVQYIIWSYTYMETWPWQNRRRNRPALTMSQVCWSCILEVDLIEEWNENILP